MWMRWLLLQLTVKNTQIYSTHILGHTNTKSHSACLCLTRSSLALNTFTSFTIHNWTSVLPKVKREGKIHSLASTSIQMQSLMIQLWSSHWRTEAMLNMNIIHLMFLHIKASYSKSPPRATFPYYARSSCSLLPLPLISNIPPFVIFTSTIFLKWLIKSVSKTMV